MPPSKALEYAEGTLGVHEVYAQAQAGAETVQRLRDELAMRRRAKHTAEEAYRDSEIEFLTDQRGNYASLSQTAWEKQAKDLVHGDPELRKLRRELADANLELEMAEAGMRRAQTDVDIAVARLHELGGYFAYLAAVKSAQTKVIATQHDPDWPGL